MEEDLVMEEAVGAMEVVVQGTATRVADLVEAAMADMEAMMEVKPTVLGVTTCSAGNLKSRLNTDTCIFRIWRGWKLQRLWQLWWTAVQLWAHEGKQLWW